MNICMRKIPLLFIICILAAIACSSSDEVALMGADLDTRLCSFDINPGFLIPGFDPAKAAYSASAVTDRVEITADCYNPKAKLFINGREAAQGVPYEVTLLEGANPITINVKVGAGAFESTRTYTLTFLSVSDSDTRLIALYPSTGTFESNFYFGTPNYTMRVPFAVKSIAFTPIAAVGGAASVYLTNAVNNVTMATETTISGTNSASLALTASAFNIISIAVKPQGHSVGTPYTVTVWREPPSTEKAILTFSFDGLANIQESLNCAINESAKEISAKLIYFTNGVPDGRVGLVPYIEVSPGATVSPASGELQDFDAPGGVLYTVTAEDESQAVYTVKITQSVPYPVIVVSYSDQNIPFGETVFVGTHIFGSAKNIAVTVSNAGWADLTINSTVTSTGGWSLQSSQSDTIPPKTVKDLVMRLIPSGANCYEDNIAEVTINNNGDPTPFSFEIQAYVYDTPVNNLLITEWAQAQKTSSLTAADCYIELRNFSTHEIILDDKIVVRSEGVSNKTFTLSQYCRYSDGNDLTRYRSFSSEPLVLEPEGVVIIIQRGGTNGSGDSNFFGADFFNHVIPPDTICALVSKVPSAGALIVNGERLTAARAYVSQGSEVWVYTPTPDGTSTGGFTGSTGAIVVFQGASSADTATINKWNAFGATKPYRKAGVWPKI